MATVTQAEVHRAIAEYLDEPLPDVMQWDSFQSHGYDSLDVVDMVFKLEDRFGVRVDDNRLRSCKAVGDVVLLFAHT